MVPLLRSIILQAKASGGLATEPAALTQELLEVRRGWFQNLAPDAIVPVPHFLGSAAGPGDLRRRRRSAVSGPAASAAALSLTRSASPAGPGGRLDCFGVDARVNFATLSRGPAGPSPDCDCSSSTTS